jgi:hypothetical protein
MFHEIDVDFGTWERQSDGEPHWMPRKSEGLCTPDGRYFVVRGRLWRMSNPHLSDTTREELVRELMAARRAVGVAKRARDRAGEDAAHARVDLAKQRLGERGPVWWTDGAPDYNRHLARTTPYASWFESLTDVPRDRSRRR